MRAQVNELGDGRVRALSDATWAIPFWNPRSSALNRGLDTACSFRGIILRRCPGSPRSCPPATAGSPLARWQGSPPIGRPRAGAGSPQLPGTQQETVQVSQVLRPLLG